MENNNKEITTSSEATDDDVCCIYKVPEFMRKKKEECYRPLVVSIGPVFYRDPQVETMQEVKWIFLESFLQHANNVCPRLDDYIKIVGRLNKEIRDCYQEQKMLLRDDDDKFVEMIVLDAIFLLTFITTNADNETTSRSPFMRSRPYPRKVNMLWTHIERDILVEENQLPLFVLKVIFGIACPTEPNSLLIDMFRYINNFDIFKNEEVDLCYSTYEIVTDFKHVLDLWWKCCCLPYARQLTEQEQVAVDQDDNAPDIEAQPIVIPNHMPMTAKQLFAAGVKFKVNDNSRNSFDIKFDNHTGELKIPKLELVNFSETYFRNIMFFEDCHYSYDHYTCIIDFLVFLDALIDTEEDIKVLQQHGVLSKLNGSEQQALGLFNDIGRSIVYIPEPFNYSGVSKQLNAYANQPWNRWMAILKRDYFNHPWAIVSFIFAIILFILTLLQTITSFTKN